VYLNLYISFRVRTQWEIARGACLSDRVKRKNAPASAVAFSWLTKKYYSFTESGFSFSRCSLRVKCGVLPTGSRAQETILAGTIALEISSRNSRVATLQERWDRLRAGLALILDQRRGDQRA